MERCFRPVARTGYAARGVVYVVIGFFAALAAIGSGRTMDTRDALQELLSSGFGSAVAVALVAGLAAYAAWRFVQSVFDTDAHGTGAKGLAVRGGLLASGITYSGLALYTFSLWRGAASSSGGGGAVASALAGFIGATATSAVLACVFAGVAIAHFVKAWKEGYARHLQASARAMRAIHPISKIGLTARGLTFLVIAVLFGYRALGERHDRGGQSVGLGDALDFIVGLPAGQWLLGAMGVGLICFAAYSLTEAWFRRINVEDARAPA